MLQFPLFKDTFLLMLCKVLLNPALDEIPARAPLPRSSLLLTSPVSSLQPPSLKGKRYLTDDPDISQVGTQRSVPTSGSSSPSKHTIACCSCLCGLKRSTLFWHSSRPQVYSGEGIFSAEDGFCPTPLGQVSHCLWEDSDVEENSHKYLPVQLISSGAQTA